MLRKRRYSVYLFSMFVIVLLAITLSATVSEGNNSGGTIEKPEGKCPNNFPSGLLTDFCYKCFFPLRIGGKKVFSYGGIPDDVDIPDLANMVKGVIGQYSIDIQNYDSKTFNPDSIVCFCKTSLGLPSVGLYISFWEPTKLMEIIMRPGCFPTLFGAELNFGGIDFGAYGTTGKGHENEQAGKAFYNVHFYNFPLMLILSAIFNFDYCRDFISDFDLLHFSEVDPTHNDDILSAFIHPEVFLFANPIAQALCAVDAITSTVGYPLNTMFWCAGSWGGLYPYTGNTGVVGSPPRVSSLIAARTLGKLGRLGLEMNTSGEGAKCGMGQDDWFLKMYMPLLKKTQYRFQTLYPIPETVGKCCHSLGANTFLWGEWRNIPTKEHFLYFMWRKRNCCLKII